MRRRERTQAEEGLCTNGHEEARVLEAGRVRHAGAARASESYDRTWRGCANTRSRSSRRRGGRRSRVCGRCSRHRCARLGDAAPGHALDPEHRRGMSELGGAHPPPPRLPRSSLRRSCPVSPWHTNQAPNTAVSALRYGALNHTKVASRMMKTKTPGKRAVCATNGWKVNGDCPHWRCRR